MHPNHTLPQEWALHIVQAIADGFGDQDHAAPWLPAMDGPPCGAADDALLDFVELQLSARVERLWGDADDLEALQRHLVRPDVRQALLTCMRQRPPRAARPAGTERAN